MPSPVRAKGKIRAIIICAGEATRWKNHLGVPKHLITIDGQTLLERTISLLRVRGVTDIHVVSKDDPRYKIKGSKQYIAKLNYEENVDADKFLSSKELWSRKSRTIVFYGDCYFTKEAMDTIIGYTKREWTLFCRPDASQITGTKWGECFAQSFYPEDIEKHEAMLHYTAELYKSGVITRCGGWEHYRAMTGRTGEKVRRPHTMTTNYVEINDWTDDFDYPEDYDVWSARRSAVLQG